jgi:hypothetical protein
MCVRGLRWGRTRKPNERKGEGKEWSEQAGSGWRRFCIIEEPGSMGGRGGRQGGAKQGASQSGVVHTVRSPSRNRSPNVPRQSQPKFALGHRQPGRCSH